ncbi:energy-coupling factor ABC transporter substrate-binding protein [Schinkia sp. CFF1]
MKSRWFILLALFITFCPLLFLGDAKFSGADGLGQEQIHDISPNYKPWFSAAFQPKSGEVESLLFAFQAALGAGFVGYFLGLYKGRREKSTKP